MKNTYSTPKVVMIEIKSYGLFCQSNYKASDVTFGNEGEAGALSEDTNWGGSY